MDDNEIQSLVSRQIDDAVSYIDSEIAPAREKATEYYQGKPFGDEEEGRSRFVSRDVRDTVKQQIPSLMRVFFGSEKVVEYTPTGPDDEEFAAQATEFVSTVVLRQDNPRAFLDFHAAFKDSLIRKTGVIKTWWEETIDVKAESYTGLDADQVTMLVDQDDVDILEQDAEVTESGIDGIPDSVSYNVKINRKRKCGRVKLCAVPPEELIVSRDARNLEDAVLVAHRATRTVSDLVELGFDFDEISALAGSDSLDSNTEASTRSLNGIDWSTSETVTDPSLRKVAYYEVYAKIDADGDGIAELRRICCAGPGKTILSNEAWDHQPFALFSADPEPHELFGMSTADDLMDIQAVKSRVVRDMLDSLGMSIHPRLGIVEGQVNLDDALNTEVGALIRMRAPGMVQPFSMPFVGQSAFPILGYLDEVKESRTGISKASAGLNADALQSTTASAVAATISAAQGQTELMARVLAEGMRQVFSNVLKLLIQNQDKARTVRLRNQWVPVDPSCWSMFDVSVDIALGRGGDTEKMTFLAAMADKQETIMSKLGFQNPLVSMAEYRKTLASMAEIAGYRDASRFFKEIDPNQPPVPQAPPQPDPIQMQMQIEQLKTQSQIQINQAKLQQDAASDQQAAQLAVEKLKAELGLKEADMQARIALEREKMMGELELKRLELIAKSEPTVDQNMQGVLQRLVEAQSQHGAAIDAIMQALNGGING